MIRTRPLRFADVLDVARRMRAADAEEIYATRYENDPVALARDCMAYPQFAWTAWLEDEPVCAIGAVPMHPGLWQAWMFATDDFPKIGGYVTKFAGRVMIRTLAESGARRAQCLSSAHHTEAHRWLRALGAVQEGPPMLDYGKNGESFLLFVWRAENVHRWRRTAA